MKKRLLLVAAICCVSAASYAQWTKPTFKNAGFTIKTVTDSEGEPEQVSDTLYLYNTEAPGFFVGANNWNTRASVGPRGYKVIIKAAVDNPGCYLICDSVETQSAVKAMFADNEQSIWVDNLTGANVNQWKIDKLEDGTYEITNQGTDGERSLAAYKLGVAEHWQGDNDNTRLWLNNPELTYEKDVDGEKVPTPVFSGNFYDKWIFVSQEDYNAAEKNENGEIVKIKQYMTAMVLKKTLEAAKAEWEGKVNFSSVEAVYNNTSSTVEELQAAIDKIPVLIAEYKSTLATFDEPTDFADLVGDGSDIGPWTREFTDTGTTGTWHTNTWSTEANDGADGTDMTTPFCEDWVASGGKLSNQKIFQTLKSAAPGLYKFTLNIRAYSEAGKLDKFEGLSMYFGDQKIDLQSQTAITYSGNKSVLWSPNYFTIIAVVKEGGDIEFGLDIAGANFNWVAFKGTSLKYYGNENVEENAAKLYKESYKYEKAEDGLVAQDKLIQAYNEAVDAFDAATTTEDITAAAKAADEAKAALDANVAAYKNLLSKIDGWEQQQTDNDYTSTRWGEFADFMQGEEQPADDEAWPMPTAYDIKNNAVYTLSTDEITAYIAKVEELIQEGIATSVKDGDDCTQMLVNPAWKEADGKGWTEVSGKCNNKNLRGGLDAFPCAESYHSIFDFQQVVNNVPDGIYSISLNGFCRLDDANETSVPAEIYMNDVSTPLQNIKDDGISPDDAVDGVNCYITQDSWQSNDLFADNSTKTPAGYDLPDQTTINENGWYTPNGMTGASIAFSADRYKATVYGLVQGGKMTIGVRNLKSTTVWALWSNFKLTYEGKNAEACGNVLASNIEQMQKYQEANEDNMSDKAKEDLANIIAVAEAAGKSGDADKMMEAILSSNKDFAAVKDLVDAFVKVEPAVDRLVTAYDDNQETASEEAKTEAENLMDAVSMANSLGLEEINALLERIETAIAKLKVPAYDGASDENPIDMSKVIVNATFDTEGDFTGWSGDSFGAGGTKSTCAERYNMNYDTYQDLAGLPAGTYELSVAGFYRQGSTADDYKNFKEENKDNYNAYLYAIGEKGDTCQAAIMSLSAGAADGSSAPATGAVLDEELGLAVPSSMADFTAWKEAGYYLPTDEYNKLYVKVGDDGKLRIGVRKTVKVGSTDWSIFDDFTLRYLGNESQKEPSTGIEGTEIAGGDAAPVSITTLNGVKVKSLQKGVNIVTKANGEKVKIYVK